MEDARPTLITGAEGQLGHAMTALFRTRGPVVACGRAELDVADPSAVERVVSSHAPSVIVNCAAQNDVDGAEEDPQRTLEINALGVRSLARAARQAGAALVHFSSDFVFDGTAGRPYVETDPPNPRSTYAASKMMGDWFTEDAGRWFVLRVESLFGVGHWPDSRRVGTIDRIIDSLRRGQPTRVFHDRIVSPAYLIDVSAATAALLDGNAASGVYHVVNTGYGTWLALAQEIAGHIGGAEHIVPIAAADLKLKAARPLFAALSNRKLAAAGYEMPPWQDAIARYLRSTTTAAAST